VDDALRRGVACLADPAHKPGALAAPRCDTAACLADPHVVALSRRMAELTRM